VVDGDVGLAEAGEDDAGEVFVVFDEEDLGGAVVAAKDAAELGEEEAVVEGLLHPTLGVAGELAAEDGREDAEDDDGDEGGGGVVAEALKGFPAAEAGHIEIEEDGFDGGLGGDCDGLFAGGGFEDGVALVHEVLPYDGADAWVIIADEDGALAARQHVGGCDCVGNAGGAGEHDVERGSGAEVALCPDGAAVLLDDGAADGEAEAGSAFLASVGGLDLLEAIEDGVEFVGGDAAAFVADFEQDGIGGGLGLDADGGGGGGELDGVGEEVGEDLEDAIAVAVEVEGVGAGAGGWFLEDDVDGSVVGHAGHGVGGLLDEVAEGAAAELEWGAAGLHTFEVEDVVDEADEAVGVGDGDAEEVLGFGVEVAHDAGGEQAEGAADAGEWCAELVRDGGDELVFKGIELGAFGELQVILLLAFAGLGELITEKVHGGTLPMQQQHQRKRCDEECETGSKRASEHR